MSSPQSVLQFLALHFAIAFIYQVCAPYWKLEFDVASGQADPLALKEATIWVLQKLPGLCSLA